MRPSIRELGIYAIKMQQERVKVEAWMRAEGQAGNLRQNDQAPTWAQYLTAVDNFNSVLQNNDWSDVEG